MHYRFSVFLYFCFLCSSTFAGEYNLSLLENVTNMDKTVAEFFNSGNDVLPGTYKLSVVVNEREVAYARNIEFKDIDGSVQPIFLCEDLQKFGFKINHCRLESGALATYIPSATVDIDLGDGILTIHVSQSLWSEPDPSDVAPSTEWNNGMTTAFSIYSMAWNNGKSNATTSVNSLYGSLENGFNIGDFQFRNLGYFTNESEDGLHYRSNSTFIRHDIDAARGTLTIGDFYTAGLFFSPLSLRGGSLSSNISMFHNAERAYSPAIIGSARSNATVTISQNSQIVAVRQVPPGPFVFKDITAFPGMALDVTVYESDGTEQHFTVSNNTISFLRPDNTLEYYLYMGNIRNNREGRLLEGNVIYGLNNRVTVLAGAQYIEDYQGMSAGLSSNIDWLGGVYILLNHSYYHGDNYSNSSQGNMLKVGYSRYIPLTGSYLYASFSHKFDQRYQEINELDTDFNDRYRDQFSLQLNQSISAFNAALNYNREQNWRGDTTQSVQASLNIPMGRATFSTSLTQSRDRYGDNDRQLAINISIPLDKKADHYLTVSHYRNDNNTSQVALTGSLLDEGALGYNISAMDSPNGVRTDASLVHKGNYGNASLGYSKEKESSVLRLGMDGSIVFHEYGVTLSRQLGGGAAFVHTDHIKGLGIENMRYVRTDFLGNTIVPDLAPYHYNELALDAGDNSSRHVKLDDSINVAIPRYGSIVEVDFEANYQQKIFVSLENHEGTPFSFGTFVYDNQDKVLGIVSEGGIASLDITDAKYPLHVQNTEGMKLECQTLGDNDDERIGVSRLICF